MAFPRRAAGQWAMLFRQRSTAFARNSYGRQNLQRIRARGYASGHGEATKSSDIPWLVGSVAISAPCLWYIGIWTPDPNAHHDDHGDHGEHEEGEEHEEESKDEGKSEDSGDDKSEDGGSDSDDNKDTPPSSDDEGDKEEENKDEGKKEKKDIKDEASTVKPAGSSNEMSGKQEGMYNADTRHSSDLQNNPDKSTKAEGGPDTAKAKGTIRTDRELPEQANKSKEA